MNASKPLASTLCAALLAGAAAAGGHPPPPLTVYETATVEARELSSATGAVTVLDRQAIVATGAGNVAELLRFVPGVVLESNGTRGGLTMARLRGGDANFTLVLIDGVPVNDPTYQTGDVFNFEALPAAAVERIEVVRGPLSAIYGSTGLAGAIHVITRRGSGTPRLDVELGAGDASRQRLALGVGGAASGRDYFLSLSHEGEEERVAEERFELTHLQGRFGAELGARTRLEVSGRAAIWEGDDYPDASGGPVFGSGELRRAENDEVSLGFELTRAGGEGAGRHKVTAAFYRHQLERASPAIFSPFVPGVPLVPESSESTRYTRGRLGWALTLEPSAAVRWSVGVDVEREAGENTSVLLLPPFLGGAVAGDYRLERTTPGAYSEVLVERDRLLFEAGLRVDVPEGASEQLSPRLGVSYRLSDASRLRASAGRAFKLPSFFALASPPQLGGNPALRPEVATGVDLGVEQSFAGGRARAGAGVFFQRYEELVDFDFELFTHLNRSRVEARGVELEASWRPSTRIRLDAQVTWQDVEDRSGGQPLRHRPEWTGGLRLAWQPRPRLDLGLDGRFSAAAFDTQIPVPDRLRFAGSELWGLRAAWSLTAGLRLVARIDNLTDAGHETMIGFPGPGRSLELSLRYRSGRAAGASL